MLHPRLWEISITFIFPDPNLTYSARFQPGVSVLLGMRLWVSSFSVNYSSLQVLGTFLLLLGIFAICDSQNSEPKAGMKPLVIGLLIWAIGGSFGLNCGYAINPARDFGPRIFTAIAGWGKDVFV